ncbi:hemingway isoform X2 [Haematobia irritans]|uniref:hemingway isoform X2 n=1 Tax=Haematobia irritans TaxID=7368 RepID=UPI003F50141A
MSNADNYNSDDELYADDTFEQESDTDVPEVAEIESEISEVSDEEDERESLPTVISNTSNIRVSTKYTNIRTVPANTDSVPFDSSSEEENDVVVGQTLVEINTPSMHFIDGEESPVSSRRERRSQRYESVRQLKSIDEQSDSSVSEEDIEDSDDEKEFQKIREMEENYLLQNSAKTPKTGLMNNESNKSEDIDRNLNPENSLKQKTEKNPQDVLDNDKENPDIDPIPELIEKVMEKFTPNSQVPPQIQTDYMEIVQNSLASLQTNSMGQTEQIEQIETIITDELRPQSYMADESIRMTFSFEPNDVLNPDNIAKAFFDAINATNATFNLDDQNHESFHRNDTNEMNASLENQMDTSKSLSKELPENPVNLNPESEKNERPTTADFGEEEIELERHKNDNPSPTATPIYEDADDNHDTESYYDTQFDYQITSKAPSCFNSDDYVFHANFIRPTPSTDNLRAKPHPRKSMSFSNERMREIERHNQILLRKILTQKPTYMSKSAQHKTNSQTNVRLTTSAVNRKKQQRQIDLDNQVLKRKIEAIALRRRPLIS